MNCVVSRMCYRVGGWGGENGLDSEYVFKGITEWSLKWKRHGRRVRSGEIGHRGLWEEIWVLCQDVGSQVTVMWTPSHPNVEGNDKADASAEEGRLQHPNNKKRWSEELWHEEHVWASVGLQPMRSDVPSSMGSAASVLSGPLLELGKGSSIACSASA